MSFYLDVGGQQLWSLNINGANFQVGVFASFRIRFKIVESDLKPE